MHTLDLVTLLIGGVFVATGVLVPVLLPAAAGLSVLVLPGTALVALGIKRPSEFLPAKKDEDK